MPFTNTFTRLPARARMCCTSTSSSRSSVEVFEDAWPVAPGKETLPCRPIVRVTPPPSLAAAIGAITAINAKQPIRAEMRDVRRMLFLRRLVTSDRQIARRPVAVAMGHWS